MGNQLEIDVSGINRILKRIGIVAPIFLSSFTQKKDDEIQVAPANSGKEIELSTASSLSFRKRKPNHQVYFNEERGRFDVLIDFSSLAKEAETYSHHKNIPETSAYAELTHKEFVHCLKQLVKCNYEKICAHHEPAYFEKFSVKYLLFISSLIELASNEPFDLHALGRFIYTAESLWIVWGLLDIARGRDSTDPFYEVYRDKLKKFKEHPLSIAVPYYMARYFIGPLIALNSSQPQLIRARLNSDE